MALKTPSLWTEFTIDFEEESRCQYLGEGPELFLSLSRSLPLDVSFQGPFGVKNPESIPRFRMVADALLQSVAR